MLMYSVVDCGTQGDEWADALALGMELVQHRMALCWGKKNSRPLSVWEKPSPY